MNRRDGSQFYDTHKNWNGWWASLTSHVGVCVPAISYWRREARYENMSIFSSFSNKEISQHGKCYEFDGQCIVPKASPGSRLLAFHLDQTSDSSAKVAIETAVQECLIACPPHLQSHINVLPFSDLHIPLLHLGTADLPSSPSPLIEWEELCRIRKNCARALPAAFRLSQITWTSDGVLVALWHPQYHQMTSPFQAASTDALRLNIRNALLTLYNERIAKISKEIQKAKNAQSGLHQNSNSTSATHQPSLQLLTYQLAQISAAKACISVSTDLLTFVTPLANILPVNSLTGQSSSRNTPVVSDAEFTYLRLVAKNTTLAFKDLEVPIASLTYTREEFMGLGTCGGSVGMTLGSQFGWGGAMGEATEEEEEGVVLEGQGGIVRLCKGIENARRVVEEFEKKYVEDVCNEQLNFYQNRQTSNTTQNITSNNGKTSNVVVDSDAKTLQEKPSHPDHLFQSLNSKHNNNPNSSSIVYRLSPPGIDTLNSKQSQSNRFQSQQQQQHQNDRLTTNSGTTGVLLSSQSAIYSQGRNPQWKQSGLLINWLNDHPAIVSSKSTKSRGSRNSSTGNQYSAQQQTSTTYYFIQFLGTFFIPRTQSERLRQIGILLCLFGANGGLYVTHLLLRKLGEGLGTVPLTGLRTGVEAVLSWQRMWIEKCISKSYEGFYWISRKVKHEINA
eukprot:GDKJ01017817.1.p1 GENE.GDKJ01017817.1~~GDKJ01017817.1.p1  ORF type:complete len:682 (-),score=108.18 GDKJ01017817.1:59-2080(-)